MKKMYRDPELELVLFSDVIVTSGEYAVVDDPAQLEGNPADEGLDIVTFDGETS